MRNGDSIRYLTTCNVADYLIKNDLYNEESEKKERILYNLHLKITKTRLIPTIIPTVIYPNSSLAH